MAEGAPWRRPALVLALVAFVAQGLWLTQTTPSWHEEVSVHASEGYRIALERDDGTIAMETSCTQPDAPLLVRSATRPVLAVCVAGHTLPVMVSSYISGIPYWPLALLWPLHHGEVFALRLLGLIFGLWALAVCHRLAARFADERSGDLAVLALASMTQFTVAHSMLVYYDVIGLSLVGTAVLVAAGPRRDGRPAPPSARRLALAGALVGLATLANIKTVLILAPLVLLAARGWRSLPRIPLRSVAAALLAAALPIGALVASAWTDPSRGMSQQLSYRLHIFVSHLDAVRFGNEVLNLFVFWSDIRFYGDLVVGAPAHVNWLGVAVAAGCLAYCTVALVGVLRRGRGAWLAAACGALLWAYVAVSVLLYDQQPAANYTPIHGVFGLTTGLALGALVAALPRGRKLAYGLSAAAIGAFALASASRLPETPNIPLSINAMAERALARHLRAHPESAGMLATTTYNLHGMIEALGAADQRPTAMHLVLSRCDQLAGDRGRASDGAAREATIACLAERWDRVLADPARVPLRAIVPVERAVIDEAWATAAEPALARAAAARGLSMRIEGRFATPDGVEALRLLRVE